MAIKRQPTTPVLLVILAFLTLGGALLWAFTGVWLLFATMGAVMVIRGCEWAFRRRRHL